ncbi:SMP-30/gluconolactonase/LRE family protein [Ensifer sp. IC3342]|nr:SMP-30/gluconolactonase/LRE family protein [Ensifer sp. BRP08]MCA1448331.1 SMP-30/gluconolactonase/LRE family protein [Ensifer sp. IC3342]
MQRRRERYRPVRAVRRDRHVVDLGHACNLLQLGQQRLESSPDGRTAYWADTTLTPHQVWRARYDPHTGRPEEKETFVVFPEGGGRPDGAAVDAAGCYWVAAVRGSQLLRFTPEGKLDLVVPMPVSRPSKIAFGGSDLNTIFVTSISEGLTPEAHAAEPLAGALLALDLGIEGLPAMHFRTSR